ncbi:MAG: class I SAM-dependent methyltransferase, partial [Pseudomonadota bacterium]
MNASASAGRPTTLDAATVHMAFGNIAYLVMDQRRLEHLATLNLPIRGRAVLELGAGAGGLTSFFINRDCEVTAVEPRAASLAVLADRFPSVRAIELDVESDVVATLPKSDIVFAYGLLYHLAEPAAALKSFAALTDGMLLLETRVDPSPERIFYRRLERTEFP